MTLGVLWHYTCVCHRAAAARVGGAGQGVAIRQIPAKARGTCTASTSASCHGARQAVVVVADAETALEVTGNGDVLEPNDGIIGMTWTIRLCIDCMLCACHCAPVSRLPHTHTHTYTYIHAGVTLALRDQKPNVTRARFCLRHHRRTAIGSGSAYALAAARALSQVEGLDAMEIGKLLQPQLHVCVDHSCMR